MASKELRTPSLTTLFHANDEQLDKFYPEFITYRSFSNQDFNSQYASSAPELRLDYNQELVEASFEPLIQIIKQSVNPLTNARLLEIGGSTGLLTKYLQDKGANITLLETQKKFADKAKERGVHDTRIYNGTNLTSVLAGEKYQTIIAHRVFEDIVMSEEQALIISRQVINILQPNGLIIIGTKSPEAVWKTAIAKGSNTNLSYSRQFPWHSYVQEVMVFSKESINHLTHNTYRVYNFLQLIQNTAFWFSTFKSISKANARLGY